MLRRSGPLLALVSTLVVLGAACGGGDSGDDNGIDQTGDGIQTTPTEPAGGEATATMGMIDFAFVPSETLLPSGTTVLLENAGQAAHTFSIEGEGIDEEVAPGETGEVTIDLEPGTYDLICRFHGGQGMVATLTIE